MIMNPKQQPDLDEEFIREEDLDEVIDLDDQHTIDHIRDDDDEDEEAQEPIMTTTEVVEDDCIYTFESHEQSVFCCHLSHNDRYAITGGQDDKAIIWDMMDNRLIRFDTNGHHKDSIVAVKFNLNSTMVATGDMSGVIIVWNVEDGKKIYEYEVGNDLNWLLWHNTIDNVLLAGTHETWMWRLSEIRPQCRTLQSFGCGNLVAELFRDGRRLAMGYEDGSIRVWNLEQNQLAITIRGNQAHHTTVTSLSLSLDDNLIATGSADGVVKMINVKNQKVITSFKLDDVIGGDDDEKKDNSIESLQFGGQNCLIIGSLDGRIQIWHVPSQTKRNQIELSRGVSKLLVDSNNVNIVYAGCLDGVFRVIDILTGNILDEKRGHRDQILDFAISSNEFMNLVMFFAHVSHCYPNDEFAVAYPSELMRLLRLFSTSLNSEVRLILVRALILMRNKSQFAANDLISLLFELLKCPDKKLRALIKQHIMVTALKFFLGTDQAEQDGDKQVDSDDSDSDSDNLPSAQEIVMANRVNKKTRKRKRLLLRSKEVLKRYRKKSRPESFDFSAIHLLNDPQGMAENLFKMLETFNERFELKLLLINLISRLVGIHELQLLNLYSYLQRYLHPKQRDVTKLLQYVAQASHELVPPDSIEPLLKVIANNFVTEQNSSEVMAVGINSIREICARCPLAISEDLLQDLVEYSSFKDKNVSMAAKSLIQLYRQLNPSLLRRKDRGRPTQAIQESVHSIRFGQSKAVDFVSGTEVLDEYESDPGDELTGKDNGDSDGSWIDVSDDEDEIAIDDYDDIQSDADENEDSTNCNSVPQDQREKASLISTSRILTQEEFHKVRMAQLSKHLRAARSKKLSKTTSTQNENESSLISSSSSIAKSEIVSLSSIERLYKSQKSDKQTRLESIEAGRKDRGKFGSRKGKINDFASKSNRETRKGKSFMMIKHKLRQKRGGRSFKDKQIALRNSLLKRFQ
ncbi:protein SDA1 homolog [Dermatophagoides farinae]|uniref:protein SDA1 homolog n=1 Tax=Dermatophagoides farinae TaxID=6954 RepID=UPI003F5E2051